MQEPEAKNIILRIIAARNKAVAAGDPGAIVANVAEDVVTFDVVAPLVTTGRKVSHDRAVVWLSNYQGKVRWDVQDIEVVASHDVAFSHFISRVRGRLNSGEEVDMWFRTTLGFQKMGKDWKIVHDHSSDPFDPDTGLALTGLRP